jgi:DNA primase catalytic core
MRFPPQFLDELRARLLVSEVVGRRVRLKKAGREWRGLSPFNQEKTPSFFVNDQKMAWFDFSSGKNGNIFDFVMMTEGLSFPEAVERLASEAGLPLPTISRADEARDERRKTLNDVMELAAKFFEATLAARWRQGTRLSRRPRARSGNAGQIPPGLRIGRALRAQGAPRQGRDIDPGHDRSRAAGCRRRHSRALRSLTR